LSRIAEETINQIRDRADIVGLIGRFVSLKQAGPNHKGLCPFHNEKTPSFNVRPDRGSFYCFGCQKGGDAITFLMEMENLTFPEAVRALGAEVGIEIAEDRSGDRGVSERLLAANAVAQSCYRAALKVPGNPGAAYLESRGIDAEACERFGIGYAPDRWDTVAQELRRQKISADDGVAAGLLSERSSGNGHYDRMRGRVTFPIEDVRGRSIGFGGRALLPDQEPKYWNTPETPVFRKREAFYGFPAALEAIRKASRSIVVEGYFDRIALERAGLGEGLATCGTSLTEEHARNLRRRSRELVLLFDGDEAGQRAIERSLEVLLPHGLRVRAAVLPAGDDPDSLLAREGAEALRVLVDGAVPAIDFAIRRAVANGCASPWEKADAVAAVAPLLALVPSDVERGEYSAQVALAVGTEAQHVETAVRRARRGEDARDAVPVAPRRAGPEERNVRQLIRSLLEHPKHGDRVAPDEVVELITDVSLGRIVCALLAACDPESPVDVEAVAQQLEAEEANSLRALAAGETLDEDAAARTIDDTLRWLQRRRAKDQQRALTDEMRRPDADWQRLMESKKPRENEREERNPPSRGSRT
jgi:DNA primase